MLLQNMLSYKFFTILRFHLLKKRISRLNVSSLFQLIYGYHCFEKYLKKNLLTRKNVTNSAVCLLQNLVMPILSFLMGSYQSLKFKKKKQMFDSFFLIKLPEFNIEQLPFGKRIKNSKISNFSNKLNLAKFYLFLYCV